MKNSTLYLHIGTHKTGTTAIQNFLWLNKDELKKQGYCYPEVGMSGVSHAGFVNTIHFEERQKALEYFIPGFEKDNSPYRQNAGETKEIIYEELTKVSSSSNFEITVISSECFFEWTNPKEFGTLFTQLYEDVNIVVYLRPQDDWMESIVNQLIKDPYFRFSGTILGIPQFALLDYYKILLRWRQAFPEARLMVRPYSGEIRENVIHDFADLLGIRISEEFVFPVSNYEINKKLHPLVVKFLYGINKEEIDEQIHKKLIERLYDISELFYSSGLVSDGILSEELKNHIRVITSRSNAELVRVFLGKDSGRCFLW